MNTKFVRVLVVLVTLAGMLALTPVPSGAWAGQYPYDGLDPEGPYAEEAGCDSAVTVRHDSLDATTPWGSVRSAGTVDLRYNRNCRVIWARTRSDLPACQWSGRNCGAASIHRNNDGATYHSRVIFGQGVWMTRWWSPMLNDKNMTSYARGQLYDGWLTYTGRTWSY